MQKAFTIIVIILAVIIALGGVSFALVMANGWMGGMMYGAHHLMDEHRLAFLDLRDNMVGEMIHQGDYACCLAKPCTYCIEKTPGHGEGATCHCLDDVMNGRHPCGECIGEILEGHGNHLLAPYFGVSISEEAGMEYLETIQRIIEDKYGLPISEQIGVE